MTSEPQQTAAFRRSLKEGSLSLPKSREFFDWATENGSMGRVDDELRVDEIMAAFKSHLHLDIHRFPPQGMISKSRLRPENIGHQPWLKLTNNDFDHDFYDDPIQEIDSLKTRTPFPDDVAADIRRAYENDCLAKDWPGLRTRLADAGVSETETQQLFEDLGRTFDLPPLRAVTRDMRRIGIPYRLARRKHAMIAYRPFEDGGEDSEIEEFRSFDIELVFVGRSGTHSIHDLGSGVKVIVPVIVALSTAEVGLLSIEEPECHVHPKLQAELGDLLIQRVHWTYYDGPMEGFQYQERWNGKHRRTSKIIIETHSEHLILRILRRIRETTRGKLRERALSVKPADVAVLYVQQLGDAGAVVKELRVNEQGRFIDDWPDGFFEDRLEELI